MTDIKTMGKKFELGQKLKDKITGFTGVATGYCEYISGCNQYLLAPGVKTDGDLPSGQWFDEQRLELLVAAEKITLDNGKTPGFDTPAPVR